MEVATVMFNLDGLLVNVSTRRITRCLSFNIGVRGLSAAIQKPTGVGFNCIVVLKRGNP